MEGPKPWEGPTQAVDPVYVCTLQRKGKKETQTNVDKYNDDEKHQHEKKITTIISETPKAEINTDEGKVKITKKREQRTND